MISLKHISKSFNEHIFRWVEYGAIDHTIIDKLQNEEESRVRLEGAEELNRCIRNMGDMQPLTSQIR